MPLIAASGAFNETRPSLVLYSALLSLFILIIAIIEGAASFDAKADMLFRNAELLNALRLKLNIAAVDPLQQNPNQVADFSKEYAHTLSQCAINHEVVDYYLHKIQNPSHYELVPSPARTAWAYLIFYLYSTWWLFAISVGSMIGLYLALRC